MRLRDREGPFGEAERRRLGGAGFGLHHQDGRREDGDWRKRGEESGLDRTVVLVSLNP